MNTRFQNQSKKRTILFAKKLVVMSVCISLLCPGNLFAVGGVTYNNAWSSGTPAAGSTFSGILSVSAGTADLSNSGSSQLTTTFSGDVTIANGATLNISNTGTGTLTNSDNATNNGFYYNTTIGSGTSTPGGTLIIGGGGSTTDIGTLYWTNGTIQCLYANGGFGTTTVNGTLVFGSGSTILALSNTGNQIAGTYTLFTLSGGYSGSSDIVSQIQISNNNSLLEVSGLSFDQSTGIVSVTLATAATTAETDPTTTLDTVSDLLPALQNLTSQATDASFTPKTPYERAAANARIAKAMRTEMIQNRADSFEALMTAMSQEETPQVVKFKGDYRIFATPYITSTQNTVGGYSNGSNQKYYGMMVGASHYFKKADVNMTLMMGIGASKMQMNSNAASKTNGKSFMAGIVLRKAFFQNMDVESNLSTIVIKNKQDRFGQPSPSQSSYVAHSAYNIYALSWRNEVGYVFKLDGGYSIKPDVGLQMNISQRTKIQEQNAGIYSQSYRAKMTRNGEIYGGVGVRKKWSGDGYEAKITVKYEVGQKSGNGKTSTTVYADSTASSLTYSSTSPGRFTQYLNVYGSILGTETNWKIVPGITATFQKGQKSLSGIMKIEKRF